MNGNDLHSAEVDYEKEHGELVARLAKDPKDILGGLTWHRTHLLHMILGVAGETGELVDSLKKSIIYGQEIDVPHIIEEIGDLEYYLRGIMDTFRITREEVLRHNIDKLNARYPEGEYTDKHAEERLDKRS